MKIFTTVVIVVFIVMFFTMSGGCATVPEVAAIQHKDDPCWPIKNPELDAHPKRCEFIQAVRFACDDPEVIRALYEYESDPDTDVWTYMGFKSKQTGCGPMGYSIITEVSDVEIVVRMPGGDGKFKSVMVQVQNLDGERRWTGYPVKLNKGVGT